MVGLPVQDSLVKHHAVSLAGSVPLRFASHQQIQIEDSPCSHLDRSIAGDAAARPRVLGANRERLFVLPRKAPMRDDMSLEVVRLRQVPILAVHS